MSFIQRGSEAILEKENGFFQVSSTKVAYELPDMATVPLMLIGEAPGEEEEKALRPFVGQSGKLLDKWLAQSRFQRGTFPIGNVFRYRPDNNRVGNFFRKEDSEAAPLCMDLCDKGGARLLEHFRSEINYLKQTIIDFAPEAIITLGATALWAVLNHDKPLSDFSERADYMCTLEHKGRYQRFTLFPAYHPAAILRDSAYEKISLRAFKTAHRFLRPAS